MRKVVGTQTLVGGKGTSWVWVRVCVRIPMGYPCLTLLPTSSAYSRIRLSSAWSLHLSFLYYMVNSFRCNLYFCTSFSSTLHSSSPFHSFRMSLPSIWYQLLPFFDAAYMVLRSIIFQSLFIATSPPDFKTVCQLSLS